jgi:hypothetical protein
MVMCFFSNASLISRSFSSRIRCFDIFRLSAFRLYIGAFSIAANLPSPKSWPHGTMVGVCALAVRETAGSEAAPAAKCRN